MILTADEVENIFDSFRDKVVRDNNIVSIEVDDGSTGSAPSIFFYVIEDNYSDIGRSFRIQRNNEYVSIPIFKRRGDPIRIELGDRDSIEKAASFDLDLQYAGMSGTQIVRSDGSWGTLTLSLGGMKIVVEQGLGLPQVCESNYPTLISNAHVTQPVGTELSFSGNVIGHTTCHFDLNRYKTIDYGQGMWENSVNVNNYWRVLEFGNPAGKMLTSTGLVYQGMAVSKQGARTGWSSGNAVARAEVKIQGYTGTFPCWRGNYTSDSGDSGAAIIQRSGDSWVWLGVHFASGPHFWSWDVIQRLGRSDIFEYSGIY